MADLLDVLLSLFSGFAKRGTPRGQSLGQVLRDALAERVTGAPSRSTSPSNPTGRGSSPLSVPAGEGPAPALFPAAATVAVPPSRSPAVIVPSPEAGLVRGLFANPQSLVAAFIVAEVLAPPVALRDR